MHFLIFPQCIIPLSFKVIKLFSNNSVAQHQGPPSEAPLSSALTVEEEEDGNILMPLVKGRLFPRSSRSIIIPLYDKRQPTENFGGEKPQDKDNWRREKKDPLVTDRKKNDEDESESFSVFFFFEKESFLSSCWSFHV